MEHINIETTISNLRTIYSECNEHLRATDQKKNQVIYFYIIIIGAYYALPQYFTKDIHYTSNFGYLALVIVGIFVILITTWYVVWHDVYVNTAIILQHLIMNQKYINRNGLLNYTEIREYISEFTKNLEKDYTGAKRKIRTEFLLIWLTALLTLLNLIIYILFFFNFYKNLHILLICVFLICILASYIITYLCQRYERIKMISILKNSWLLKF